MARFLLLLLLFVAIVLELTLTGGAFFAPAFTLGKFGVKYGLVFAVCISRSGTGFCLGMAAPPALCRPVLLAGGVVDGHRRGHLRRLR